MKATSFISTSDRRLKTDIRHVEGLNSIRELDGVSYAWKADGKPDMGLIAQEVEDVFPNAVVTDKNGYKAVKYQSLIAPLIEAVKELEQITSGSKLICEDVRIKNERLENDVARLKKQNEVLQNQLNNVLQRLERLERGPARAQ